MSVIAKQVTVNGTVMFPSDISREIEKVGETIEALNGTTRFYYRRIRRIWTLSWNSVSENTALAIFNIATIPTSMPFIDEFGISYTVISEKLESTWGADSVGLDGEVIFKKLEFTIKEA